MTSWFDWSETQDGLQITFKTSPSRYWPPEILQARPLPAVFKDRKVVLTGPGPVWMYAHTAAQASAGGASVIEAKSMINGFHQSLDGCTCRLIQPEAPSAAPVVLEIEVPSAPPLADEAMARLLETSLQELRKRPPAELCITGKTSGKAYAAVAQRAVGWGVRRITCWTPVDGLVVIHGPEGTHLGERLPPPPWLNQVRQPPEKPIIIGIAGDPNCGKSVFSFALNHYRGQKGCLGWRLDCDGQSPTTEWYLHLRQQNTTEATQARNTIKRDWSDEMEDHITIQLKQLRHFFALSVADLPGGNHKAKPPLRVPPHREVIFREVDVLILVERAEKPSEMEWREALRPHGLDQRIAAVLRSTNPQGPPSMEVWRDGDLWRGNVAGLDRSQGPDQLLAAFQTGLDQLWPTLLKKDAPDGERKE